jgi:hypothetical protein
MASRRTPAVLRRIVADLCFCGFSPEVNTTGRRYRVYWTQDGRRHRLVLPKKCVGYDETVALATLRRLLVAGARAA